MKNVVLATAGHIDHGKTELTRALTGIETDRLPEEKERGITIDLGFAHLLLGDARVAVIDVPGHERFVKNMLAGVGAVDVALLVIASDESVMPQTREHVAILELLGVSSGLVALTKVDLVDDEMLELVRLEVADLTKGTFFEDAPVVAVSARTGDGIEALRTTLERAVAAVVERDAGGPFRQHLDRAFSVRGFGSVVTGTVVSGTVSVGDEIEIAPTGRTSKVRGIEAHGAEVQEARAGSRAALNLAGVDLESIGRGHQLVTPRRFRASTLVDVRVRLLADTKWELEDLMRVRVHLGATEVLARAKLLGHHDDTIHAGGRGLVQLRLERPVLVFPGDRFIVRSYSPITTIGGGVVLDLPSTKHRGAAGVAAEFLTALEGATPSERLGLLIARAGRRGVTLAELAARSGWMSDVVAAELANVAAVRVDGASPRSFAVESWRELKEESLRMLRVFHEREPLRDGMSREELRARLFPSDAASARRLLEDLANDGQVRLLDERVALAAHRIELSDDEQRSKATIEESYRRAALNPLATKEVLAPHGTKGEDLLAVLVREGLLVALAGGLYFHRSALDALIQTIAARSGETLSVARFKELTGTSRKYAIPLLEHLDGLRVTRRAGDDRVVS